MFVPLNAWAPDEDPTIPGIITDCTNLVPSKRGYKSAPTGSVTGLPALAAECRGAAMVTKIDGTNILYAGTQTKIYKAGVTSWTDVSRITSDYTGSSSSKWCFAQQGNITFAVQKTDISQFFGAAATDFADLAAMPKANLVETWGNFVVVADYNNGTDTPDGYATSAIADYTNWTASVTTQCVYGRLYDTPGGCTGLKAIGDYLCVFKKRSFYLGRYVGSPSVIEFSLISSIIGAVSQESIVRVGQILYFVGDDNIWAFDTASTTPIGEPIRSFFNGDCNNLYRNLTKGQHDRINGIVYWFYARSPSVTTNAFIAYNHRTNKWGKGTVSVEATTEYIVPASDYDTLNAAYTTYDAFPSGSYDSISQSGDSPLPAYFDTSHQIRTFTGSNSTYELVTGDYGMDGEISLVQRVRPRYQANPTSSTLTNYYKDNKGSALTVGVSTTESSGKYDLLRAARWHRAKLAGSGDMEISGLDITAKNAGRE